MQKATKIILGIDPGTIVMGFGLIAAEANKISLIEMGVLKLSAKDDAYMRLQKIHAKVVEIILQHKPDSFAIEAPFFGKNVQSMLKLGRAQGVAIAAAMQSGLLVNEYSPRKIKQSVTGNGNAGKDQVVKMLETLLHFTSEAKQFDATDALAVAVCHHYQMSSPLKSVRGGDGKWESFIKNNPGRIK